MGEKSTGNLQYIQLNQKTLLQENIQSNRIILHFGALTKKFNIKINNELETGKVIFPRKLTQRIALPDLPYDYHFKGRHLFVGPVIGMLVLPLYHKNPNMQLLRFTEYHKIKGLVFIFKERKINRKEKTIDGYYYDPRINGFVQGIFPYPSVIFNRVRMKKETYDHFRAYIGDKIFNYPYGNTDKWSLWERLVTNASIKEHLPRTMEYNKTNLEQMLRDFDEIYLKPTSLAGGNGILHVKKIKEGYQLTDIAGLQSFIRSFKNLYRKIKIGSVKNRSYIIQQGIPYYHHGSKVDFRVYCQKDKTKKWNYSGMESKIAQKGSIISNSMNRKAILPGESSLLSIYGLKKLQVPIKVKEISQFCIKVLQTMSNPGDHFGDAAVDLVIGRDHKIWLLEVQINYAAEIKANRDRGERHILPNILPTPFEYAKALTEFAE